MASNQAWNAKVVCSILYTKENIAVAALRQITNVVSNYQSSEMTELQT
jgi:hypothetical protein